MRRPRRALLRPEPGVDRARAVLRGRRTRTGDEQQGPHVPLVTHRPGARQCRQRTNQEVSVSPEQFDLIVIGAGSAARDAAGKAKREYGASVAMIERKRWGGSCPNVACRPTKAYLTAAELVHDVNTEAANRGISVSRAEIDMSRLRAWKDSIRRDQASWVEVLGEQYEAVAGEAVFVDRE